MSEVQNQSETPQKLPWTDDRVELLKKLWAEGLSASQIATKLAGGVTRNAVIGKVHRMGLSGRVTRTRVSTPRTRKTREPSHPGRPSGSATRSAMTVGNNALKPLSESKPDPIVEPVPIHIADIPEGERVTILMLSDKTCRWPLGDPGSEDFCFCGKPPKEGAPYCPGHAQIAYQPHRERGRRSGT